MRIFLLNIPNYFSQLFNIKYQVSRHRYEDDAKSFMDRLGERLFPGTDKERTNLVSVQKKIIG
jgi:hypothetical protein